uniref:DUF2939 domain-containing protein n=1 Tax=uncultured Altererythrobacter sp. TaxID=500840 RepID=UPI0026039764|nr:DUF2939 domain-containing protein [uncultured Altererythrobacter sp.]
MKKRILLSVIVVLIVGTFYFGSPYWAAYSLKNAAVEGDKDALEELVDFASVREGLKSQMTLALTDAMQNDPEMANNPFAGLGMMLVPAIVEKAVDVYVTSDGITKLSQGKRPTEADEAENPEPNYSFDWVSIDRIRVTPELGEEKADPPSFLFERKSIFSWKLIKIELSDAMFDEMSEVSGT